jgi:hypothetical protein
MKRLALVVAVLALAVPASASAADYRGKTSQGLKVSAFVKGGRLKLLKINWSGRCDHSGPWKARTRWEDKPEGPIEHDGSKFSDSGETETRYPDGRVVYNQKLSGEILKGRIRGKMTVRMKLYSVEGEHVNNCRGTFTFDIPKV